MLMLPLILFRNNLGQEFQLRAMCPRLFSYLHERAQDKWAEIRVELTEANNLSLGEEMRSPTRK